MEVLSEGNAGGETHEGHRKIQPGKGTDVVSPAIAPFLSQLKNHPQKSSFRTIPFLLGRSNHMINDGIKRIKTVKGIRQ
jgi:hypothetical protein